MFDKFVSLEYFIAYRLLSVLNVFGLNVLICRLDRSDVTSESGFSAHTHTHTHMYTMAIISVCRFLSSQGHRSTQLALLVTTPSQSLHYLLLTLVPLHLCRKLEFYSKNSVITSHFQLLCCNCMIHFHFVYS